MSQSRQLAAIMFTDIVGYTAMMQADEQKAVSVIKHYNSTLEKLVSKFNGKVLNYYGDGSLCIFHSATNAANCALAVQQELKTEPVVPLRIGLHIGEVFFEDENALGDGVNVASRIQSLGQENTILISEEVYNTIKNNSSISAISLRHFEFKNVGKAIEVFALTNEGLFVPHRKKMEGKLKKNSVKKRNIIATLSFIMIAVTVFFVYKSFIYKSGPLESNTVRSRILVLPFTTADTSRLYYANGITVDLVTEMGKIRSFTTLAWNASFNYSNSSKSNREIAEETNATHIIVGAVQRNGSIVRINIALIDPTTSESLWTESWDTNESEILNIQKQIAVEVSKSLDLQLTPEEDKILSARYKIKDIAAYDLLLKARAEVRKFYNVANPLYQAVSYLDSALALDPNFPDALILKAYIRVELAWCDRLDPIIQYQEAKKELDRAIIQSPNSSDAYATYGMINFYLLWDMEQSLKDFEKSWQLSNYGETSIYQCNCGYVGYNIGKGDYSKALKIIEKIEGLDPTYVFGFVERLIIYRMEGNTEKIKEIYSADVAARTEPFKPAYWYEVGNFEESIRYFEKANVDFIWPTSYLASAYYKAGYINQSDSIIQNMIRRSKTERNFDFGLSVIYAARGDKENAVKWFKSAYEKHDYWLPYARGDADLKLILNEPEVQAILKKMGL